MKIKEWWSNLKGWQKGAFVGLVIFACFIIIIDSCLSFFSTCGSLSKRDCENLRAVFCGKWAANGYSDKEPKGGWDAYAYECIPEYQIYAGNRPSETEGVVINCCVEHCTDADKDGYVGD